MRSRDRARGCGERVSLSYASGAARLRQLRATGQRSPDWWIVRLLTKKRFWLGATVMCGFPVKPAGCCDVARRRNDAVDPESPLSRQNCKVTVVGGPLAGVSLSASKLAAYSRLSGRFYGERGCQRAGQSPKNFPTNKIFLPPIPGLGAEVFHPLNSGSSLFPMGEQTKPILSFGGIDRSWASSRDESLRERLRLIVSARGFLGPAHRRQVIAVCDQQTPPLTPETISRRAAPTFRHLAKLISGFLL